MIWRPFIDDGFELLELLNGQDAAIGRKSQMDDVLFRNFPCRLIVGADLPGQGIGIIDDQRDIFWREASARQRDVLLRFGLKCSEKNDGA